MISPYLKNIGIDTHQFLSIYVSLYIHGGRDIKVGPIHTMWRINLSALNDLRYHNDAGVQWEAVN